MNYVSQSERIAKLTSDNAKSLLNDLRNAIMDCVVIPNNCLPSHFHDNKTLSDDGNNGPTLAQIQRKLDKIASDPVRRKREEKERRIALYAAMHENNQVLGNEFEFEYCDPDEFWQEPKFAKLAHDIATA